jgi:hypothetical protein
MPPPPKKRIQRFRKWIFSRRKGGEAAAIQWLRIAFSLIDDYFPALSLEEGDRFCAWNTVFFHKYETMRKWGILELYL